MRVRSGVALGFVAMVFAVSAHAAAPAPGVRIYRLQTMGRLRVSLPVEPGAGKAMYRDAQGKWRAVADPVEDGLLEFELDVGDLDRGRTTLVLGAPESVNLDDQTPPQVVRFEVDGVPQGAGSTVELGGVERAPQRVLIEVADDLNDLKTDSLSVNVNGAPFGAGAPGVEVKSANARRCTVDLDLTRLLKTARRENTVSVRIDDRAVDDRALVCTLSFGCVKPHTLQDGTVASIDSLDGNPGWADWTVMFDGVKMDSSQGTTAGYTWLSAATAFPHWVRLEFAKPKTVKGVAVWWAYWKGYRTSAAYKVQTWNGREWVTQVETKDQKPVQASRHTFAPVLTKAVRVWQPSMSGHPAESQYMWVSEVEVVE